MIKIGTVCTGIGSPEQAIKELGIDNEVVFGCEIDKYAKQTYLANFTPKFMLQDMTTEDWSNPELYVDLFVGGIPCQSFSLAGKRLGELDPRGLLFYNFYDYVKQQKPKYFIIENVKGLLSDAGGKTFQNWLDLLGQSVNTEYVMFPHEDSLLYNLHWTVLNSKDFGVPQNRERVFLVGIRNDLPNDFRFPLGWTLDKRLKDILEPVVDEKYYLSDKMLEGFFAAKGDNKIGFINQDTQASSVFSAENVSPTLTSGTHGYAQGYIKVPEATQKGFDIATEGDSINISQPNSKTRRGRVGKQIDNTLETQANQVVVEPSLQKIGQLPGYESAGRIYSPEGLSPTVTAKQGSGHEPFTQTHNRIRRLTPLECFRLQGFPDSFVKPVSDTQQYKQAGNTITVTVIKAILKNLLKAP